MEGNKRYVSTLNFKIQLNYTGKFRLGF